MNDLKEQNISRLRDVLHDLTKPLCSHYGAIIGLLAFGTPVGYSDIFDFNIV